ncbi:MULTISPECIES: tRNA (N(6)-L-threonylcarbamoyladenosine(37)-C(2))-methylthiotransferase MtaB [unclassified Campylobacter]|uniref:tRNA (N(6)-L-threonylcarbamoyladenosine(37)-C(2))- methylthiotransferase MtaB n=1 Tax=unclassified Campylobacter TaxID=2593542 RepID=UPI001237CBE1|nr:MULTISPECIES: tRNA (N(6)-L-threonylcarbamoyladenosine(37)-C(2))-methylthiotransferase MtaB [unclassified Campylobacter]KAA6226409.1 tRNA (N(6)-L-threonylcarbamoyladenosine(37)-C(2))-methylthiotransferase MtaB [Campylobacter sp. LR286c]KAA6226897.1 tRNA (N(6)-L-threonylcarbamoyladenosine(37)-C(2))-methylthiotransferase MtaB [Campylobacter sp. LR196d]KAA6233861.1 tRNA (N(6)-L-threonylcarbamoyladenosine(37)-C(2))-methylthiotransferase MtaB [Campylobacter sp. LR264d]
MKVFFKTFGCRTNIYDTELLKSYVKDFELTNDENLASIVVINSCTVTNGADSGLQNYVNSLQKKGIKVLITGCGAFSKGQNLLKRGEIFGVFGASKKEKINEFLKAKTSFLELGNLEFIDKNIVTTYKNHSKAFVKIQEGCNFSCSYCIIPAVRGKSRSVDEKTLLNQIKILTQNGFNEIILTGTNIGSYGQKMGTNLGLLLQKIGKINGVKRVRLGSLEPSQLNEDFFEILNEPWIERHLHIALQHTSNQMLKIMRRKNRFESDLKLFEFLASKNYALGTDFIVAHPGESDEIWKEGLDNFKKLPLTHLHAFIFSPRNNTYSAILKERINGKIAKQRLNLLKEIVAKNNFEFRKKQKGLNVLVESLKNDYYEGFDEFYNKMKIKSKNDISKTWVNIENYIVQSEFNLAKESYEK